MSSLPPLDDRTADAVLSGRSSSDDRPDLAALSALVDTLRHASQASATPSAELHRVLTEGISTDEGDLPVTAASDAHGPAATQVPGPPTWRSKKVLEIIAAKIAAASLAAKAGVASAAVLAASAGAGAAGVLPDALQGSLDELRDRDQVEEIVDEDVDVATDDTVDEVPEELDEAPDADDSDGFGARVSEDASDPDDPGVGGPTIADEASEGRSTEARERASDASDGRADAGEEAATERRAPSTTPAPATPPVDPTDQDGDEARAGAPDEVPPAPEAGSDTRGAPSGTPGR